MKPHVVILTGAGISAESGLPTFRDANGVWEGHRFEDVATPEAFQRDPELVHRFYNLRRAAAIRVAPNAAHAAIARLEAALPEHCLLVTQNIDGLHQRAGSQPLCMHGEIAKARCASCGEISECPGDLDTASVCQACSATGSLRPHVVWFGEMPLFLDEISEALARCDYFLSIGTSGHVYPAAGFARMANQSGARCIEFNVAETMTSRDFHEHITGPATETVPLWISEFARGHGIEISS
ncbi:MAG: NAD-dependent deacylase [Verrucomicrobiales bacterium]